ncbi:MAG TPA: hypothetical protein VFB66_25690 [Tepidisphaeraceae bacterium]|nr:hypothetical protein [Tepidisphaeraceae bacterium]
MSSVVPYAPPPLTDAPLRGKPRSVTTPRMVYVLPGSYRQLMSIAWPETVSGFIQLSGLSDPPSAASAVIVHVPGGTPKL